MIIKLLVAAVLAGTPLLFGTLGEILTEKSGNLNLGVEGQMFMGAAFGLGAAWAFEQAAGSGGFAAALVALVAAFVAGALGALIYAFLTITLHANQNVTGLTLTIFGTGLGNLFGEYMGKVAGGFVAVGDATKQAFSPLDFGPLTDIPVLGPLLFSYSWMVYFALALALVMIFFFKKTRVGMHLVAVGENPQAADAAGIDVAQFRYLATIIGGGLCGIGGMYVSMVTTQGVWVHNSVSGIGWLSVALVIFATWDPAKALYCALIFGGLTVLRMYFPITGIPTQIFDMLPYVVTIIVLIITSIQNKPENAPPAASGQDYFREER